MKLLSRRTLLENGALAGALTLAGCATSGEPDQDNNEAPTTTESPTVEPGDETSTPTGAATVGVDDSRTRQRSLNSKLRPHPPLSELNSPILVSRKRGLALEKQSFSVTKMAPATGSCPSQRPTSDRTSLQRKRVKAAGDIRTSTSTHGTKRYGIPSRGKVPSRRRIGCSRGEKTERVSPMETTGSPRRYETRMTTSYK